MDKESRNIKEFASRRKSPYLSGKMMRVPWFVLLMALVLEAGAHPGLLRAIRAVTGELQVAPENADLLVKRGQLYRLHEDWEPARSDLEAALKQKPGDGEILEALGEVYFGCEDFDAAKRISLDRLKQESTGSAHWLLARSCDQLGDVDAANEAFVKAESLFGKTESAFAKDYVVFLAENEFAEKATGYLDGFDAEDNQRFELRVALVDTLREKGNYKKALALTEQYLPGAYPIHWSAEKGLLLTHLKRKVEAMEAYQSGIVALGERPPAERRSVRFRVLRARLKEGLEKASQEEE